MKFLTLSLITHSLLVSTLSTANPSKFAAGQEPSKEASKEPSKELNKEKNVPTPASDRTENENSVKIGVKGMVCAFCAQGIEKSFLSQPEVESIKVSLENKFITLKFKAGKNLSQEKIGTILKDAGYEAIFGS